MVDPTLVLIGALVAFCGTWNAVQIRDFILKIRDLQTKGRRIDTLKNQNDTKLRHILDKLQQKARASGNDIESLDACISGKITRGSTVAMSKLDNQPIEKLINKKFDRREPVFIKNYFMSSGWWPVELKQEIETENFYVFDE